MTLSYPNLALQVWSKYFHAESQTTQPFIERGQRSKRWCGNEEDEDVAAKLKFVIGRVQSLEEISRKNTIELYFFMCNTLQFVSSVHTCRFSWKMSVILEAAKSKVEFAPMVKVDSNDRYYM